MFAFQILFGNVEANGYRCFARKFNVKNFISVSAPVTNLPVIFLF